MMMMYEMMYLDNTKRFAWVGRIEIRNVPRQRNGQHMFTLPQTRDLLIFNSGAHGKLGNETHGSDIPSFACLVTRCGQQSLAVGAPRNSVDSSIVRWASC